MFTRELGKEPSPSSGRSIPRPYLGERARPNRFSINALQDFPTRIAGLQPAEQMRATERAGHSFSKVKVLAPAQTLALKESLKSGACAGFWTNSGFTCRS